MALCIVLQAFRIWDYHGEMHSMGVEWVGSRRTLR
jgi:hypothetical protein